MFHMPFSAPNTVLSLYALAISFNPHEKPMRCAMIYR